ncbi:hypothetical protein Tco_0635261 [Tanacetum coccineum]
MRELREDTFSGNKNDDAHEHVERILDIVSLFNIPRVTHNVVMYVYFHHSHWSCKEMGGQTTSRNNQHMGFAQKGFHLKNDGLTSRKVSNGSSDGIAAITSKLDSLGRDTKKLKENVKSIEQVKYGEFGRSFPNNNMNDARYRICPSGYYTHVDNQPPFGEKKPSLEKLMNKHLEESTRRRAEMEDWMKKLQESTYLNTETKKYFMIHSLRSPIEPDQGGLTSIAMNNNSRNDPLLEAVNSSDSLPEFESFHFDPSFPRPPPEPRDVEICLHFEPDAPVVDNFNELNDDKEGGEIDFSQNVKDDDSFTFFI